MNNLKHIDMRQFGVKNYFKAKDIIRACYSKPKGLKLILRVYHFHFTKLEIQQIRDSIPKNCEIIVIVDRTLSDQQL